MTKQKKIMLLGGIYYLKPAIEAAHKLGLYVITADYLPNNPAHQWSDEYVNVSIIDKDAVLKVAREKQIDGILSYAVDPGVVTAAYVAEQMGLPFPCSYKTAVILQNKSLFRTYLKDHNFNTPNILCFSSLEDALLHQTLILNMGFPLIVKPVDSAGSKGVSRINSADEIERAIIHASAQSHCGQIIVEDYLEKEGNSAGSEMFVLDGKIIYNGSYDQWFDKDVVNPYTPSGESWPSRMKKSYLLEIQNEFQRLISLLGIKTGLFNLEFRKCTNGKVYLMEVSPRAGGNRLAEVIRLATGDDLIDASVRSAMNESILLSQHQYDGYWINVVLHSHQIGILDGVMWNDISYKKFCKELTLYRPIGTELRPFAGANDAVGTAFLRFNTQKELDVFASSMMNSIKIIVR